MPNSYYVIHLDERAKKDSDKINPDKEIYAQLRRFAYSGTFASSVRDEFNLKDYNLHPIKVRQFVSEFNPNVRMPEIAYLPLSEIVNKEDYSYIIRKCKEIFVKRNPRISVNKLQ